ncbi:hypothetical protein [Streptomyces sp. GbtcB6]|uniref:hypothetical protein n=1 Tax=Streptomyces sp. GbtcB6 TaxID=2824751 RepID=UPI001C30AB0E|nr:hypothetical protein [Streptomyces sp. GbtcB6]
MRPLYVPVRLAVTVMAVAAAAGCVNVGDDAGKAKPSHSAGHRGGDVAEGSSGVSGDGGAGYGGAVADGRRGHGEKAKPGESASASAKPTKGASAASAVPTKPGKTVAPGVPAGPTGAPTTPAPPAASPTPPPASPTPPPPATDPPSAEPSSSAHEDTGTQLVQREPAPEAGTPA